MIEAFNLLVLSLGQAPAVDQTGSASVSLTFKDWITIFTSVGVPMGAAIAWIASFYKQHIDTLEKQYQASVANLREAFSISERRSNALVQKQLNEIKELDEKIKRLENIYSVEFMGSEKTKPFLDLLMINLRHIQNEVQDQRLHSEIKKLEDYCQYTFNSLLGKQAVQIEAAEWLTTNRSDLVDEAIDHLKDQRVESQRELYKKVVIQYINWLDNSLRRGKLLTNVELSHLGTCKPHQIVQILRFIKDRKAPEELSSGASIELQTFLSQIIIELSLKKR